MLRRNMAMFVLVACSHASGPVVVTDGLRLTYSIDTKEPALIDRAVHVIRRRLELAHATGTVIARGGQLEIDLADAPQEQIARTKEIVARSGWLEAKVVDDGSAHMHDLARTAAADLDAARDGIEAHSDLWRAADGTEHSDIYLFAHDRAALEHYLGRARVPDDHLIVYERTGDTWRSFYVLRDNTALTSDSAAVGEHPFGDKMTYDVVLSLDHDSAARWTELTQRTVGKKLAIMLDGRVLQAPVLMTPITNGKMSLRLESREDADDLAAVLAGGRMPAPVVLETIVRLRGGQVVANP